MLLHAGLEASSSINSSQLQLQARQLHEVASSCTMLQQQLLALTNQVDPAAATLLAAAAAGDKDANAAFCRHAGGCQHSAGGRAEHSVSKPNCSGRHSRMRVQGCTDADGSSSLCSWLSEGQRDEDSSSGAAAEVAATGAACDSTCTAGGGGGGVLRHLPVTMRLLLLENSLQEVSSAMANKAAAGERVQQRCKPIVHEPLHAAMPAASLNMAACQWQDHTRIASISATVTKADPATVMHCCALTYAVVQGA
jgi:hypothetical protein